jgi:hypothetical protein
MAGADVFLYAPGAHAVGFFCQLSRQGFAAHVPQEPFACPLPVQHYPEFVMVV